MQFETLNWMDVEAYLERDNRVILITGATEQHAYLSLLTDILIPRNLATALVQRDPVLIAPPLNFGVSDIFAEYPGTISLSQQTFDSVLTDIVESLLHQGFERFFILNGHGGNKIPARLEELQLDGVMRFVWFDWWRGDAVNAFELEQGIQLNHANWGENFPFNRLTTSPTSPKAPVEDDYLEPGESLRSILGDGSYGGLYQVDDAITQTLFDRVVEEAAALLATL